MKRKVYMVDGEGYVGNLFETYMEILKKFVNRDILKLIGKKIKNNFKIENNLILFPKVYFQHSKKGRFIQNITKNINKLFITKPTRVRSCFYSNVRMFQKHTKSTNIVLQTCVMNFEGLKEVENGNDKLIFSCRNIKFIREMKYFDDVLKKLFITMIKNYTFETFFRKKQIKINILKNYLTYFSFFKVKSHGEFIENILEAINNKEYPILHLNAKDTKVFDKNGKRILTLPSESSQVVLLLELKSVSFTSSGLSFQNWKLLQMKVIKNCSEICKVKEES
jgi:hypothetical protein